MDEGLDFFLYLFRFVYLIFEEWTDSRTNALDIVGPY